MSRYTYTLNPGKQEPEKRASYKRHQLEKMTTFQLREICRKERLASLMDSLDRDGVIRLIMRFRGQTDYRHITEFCEGGMERIQETLRKNTITVTQEGKIQVPASITIYHDMEIDELDKWQIEARDSALYEGNVLLVDENYKIYSCFYIKQKEECFWICKGKTVPVFELEKHQYFILYFPAVRVSEYLYERYWNLDSQFPGSFHAIMIPLLDVEVREANETDIPLVIDFGSCNTTMGVCSSDGSRKIAVSGNGHVIPSVIGIAGAHDEIIDYAFGVDAIGLSKNNYLDQEVPVFYDIKRWISDPDRMESVILNNGVKVSVDRRTMLKEYFTYLLEFARKQFKCQFKQVQLLAPIRQKEKFRELFQDILSESEVECVLDEGMAVLFSSIDRLITAGSYTPDQWYHALIIDCGGGTTDLTSGHFRIYSDRVSYHIDLETSYENGDSNFGGNNLTYRILQILKIKIGQALLDFVQDVKIGEAGWEEPYKNLEEQYQFMEHVIPTRFADYTEKERETYFYVKNNYYYLFNLAEYIKKSFFQQEFQYDLLISTQKDNERGNRNGLFLDKWKLSVMQNGQLKKLEKDISFSLYLHQIEALMRPDIYRLMRRFLMSKFRKDELRTYNIIKLTGQSCKSRLFEEALKEYVPGILIQKESGIKSGNDLKMCCLEGALSYFYNCKLGYMNVSQSYDVGTLPYEIMVYTHEKKAITLVHSMDREDHIGFISRFMVGKQLDIHLLDSSGEHLKTCYYECDIKKFERTTQEEIDRKYTGTVIQEETDIILEGEMKFFVWVSRKSWGFFVLPVLRENGGLYKGKETFFDFEDDTWEENFFNGRK